MKKYAVWIGLVLVGVTLAATQSLTLVLNGKVSSDKAISVNGKTYVPLSSLTALGIQVLSASGTVRLTSGSSTPGGANPVIAASGCLGELLFNGAWRFKVSKLEYDPAEKAWKVSAELRNGMNKTAMVFNSGSNYGGQDMSLVQQSGSTLSIGTNEGNNLDSTFLYKTLAPGASAVTSMLFYTDKESDKPSKFLWAMSAANNSDKAPLSNQSAFRVDLTCKK